MPYNNLIGEMAKRHITNVDMSKLLGIHRNSVNNKLSGKSKFTVQEAFEIQRAFFDDLPIAFLFETEAEQPTTTSI